MLGNVNVMERGKFGSKSYPGLGKESNCAGALKTATPGFHWKQPQKVVWLMSMKLY